MKKRVEGGFSPVETILVLIIVGLVAFVGWYVFHTKSNTDATYGNAANVQSNLPTKTKASTTASKIVQTKTDSKLGQYLADANGNALYTYDKDTDNTSNCSGSCLTNWPAYKATSTSATLPTNVGTITRSDGGVQYTYKKKPLYTFTSDTAGKVTGDGVEGFSVAKP
jgi:predicted lipoprotein with Yx(FWY)xxD motif